MSGMQRWFEKNLKKYLGNLCQRSPPLKKAVFWDFLNNYFCLYLDIQWSSLLGPLYIWGCHCPIPAGLKAFFLAFCLSLSAKNETKVCYFFFLDAFLKVWQILTKSGKEVIEASRDGCLLQLSVLLTSTQLTSAPWSLPAHLCHLFLSMEINALSQGKVSLQCVTIQMNF